MRLFMTELSQESDGCNLELFGAATDSGLESVVRGVSMTKLVKGHQVCVATGLAINGSPPHRFGGVKYRVAEDERLKATISPGPSPTTEYETTLN